jgi:molybdenum-dependent DNA-binding transcriptional regulator ModE
MDKNISHNISETCKKLGIDYKSCNPNYVEFTNDAQQLVQLYKDIQQIVYKLDEISLRHNIPALKEMIKFDIDQLNAIDHDLIRLSSKLIDEEKNDNK